jgi:hypothetical protein
MLSNPEKLKEHLTIYAPLLKAVIAMPASYRVRREFLEESLASGSYFKVSILDDKEKELFSLRINVTAAGVFVKEFITDKVSIEVNRPEMTEIKGLLEELIKTTNI